METQLADALSLLAIGMITVFVVLLLVVITGNMLIRLTNAIAPSINSAGASQLEKKKIAAITAALEVFTHGEGKVTRIQKK